MLWTAVGVSNISFILPTLQAEWGLSTRQQGWLASVTVIGMMVGSVLAGRLSDRIGRRSTLALTLLWQGIFSTLSAFSTGYPVLLGLRLLAGLGWGAIPPVASTLVSEFLPARSRGKILVMLNAFWGLGSAVAALAGYGMVGNYGWRPVLLVSGFSILCVPLVQWMLPESLRFLLGKGRLVEAQQTLARIRIQPDPAAAAAATAAATATTAAAAAPPATVSATSLATAYPPAAGQSYARTSLPAVAHPPGSPAGNNGVPVHPWTAPYLGRTASLWLLWFAFNFTFQGVFIWLPSILLAGGNSLSRSFLFSLVISLGQVPGAILAALLADRFSRRVGLALVIAFWSAAVFLFGLSANPASVLFWGFLLAIGNGAAWGMGYPFTTEQYPTRMRGAATGWATGFGRLGGIIAPLVVGSLIQAGAGNAAIFSLLAAVPLLSSLVLLGLRQETTGRALEEISS
jgi:putative MFS transporter